MSTRKSHKPKRLWKRPAERVKPETQPVESPVTSAESTTTTGEASAASVSPTNPIASIVLATYAAGASNTDAKDGPNSTVILAPPKPEKPYWYRPPDSKARKYFAKIAVMRAAGHDDEYAAKKLGTTAASVRQYVYLAKMNGWADQDGEPVDLEAQMAMDVDRKLVRNIDHALDGGYTNYQTHEVTLALMKQRKVVSNVEQGGSDANAMHVVAIQVVMPPVGAGDQQIVEANVGGVPAFLEGQVDGESLGQAGNAVDQGPETTRGA